MSQYSAIKAAVNAYIKANGRKEITGNILNAVLNATIDSLGKFYQFAGEALPSTDPGTPDQNVTYIAGTAGTYTNFDGITLDSQEIALLMWNGEWFKHTMLIGIKEVVASVDDQVGTPSVDVTFVDCVLTLAFHNMKGEPGETGAAAGFGSVTADVDSGIGTPGVSVETSGADTAKNFTFHFHNLKGETGVTAVNVGVDNSIGVPSATATLSGQTLTISFHNLKGQKGDTGSSVSYPFTLVNDTDTDDPLQALTAAMGYYLQEQINNLILQVTTMDVDVDFTLASGYIYAPDGRVLSSTVNEYAKVRVPAGALKLKFKGNYTVTLGDVGYCFYDIDGHFISGTGVKYDYGSPVKSYKDYMVDVPAGAVYFGFSIYQEFDSYAYLKAVYPKKIQTEEIADGAISLPKLKSGNDPDALVGNPQEYISYNRLDISASAYGYINKNNGSFNSLSPGNCSASDFIPVSVNGLRCYCARTYGSLGGHAVYDADKNYLRSTANPYTYVAGDAFVRFTFDPTSNYKFVLDDDITITGLFTPAYQEQTIIPYVGKPIFSQDNIPALLPAFSSVGRDGGSAYIATLDYSAGTDDGKILKITTFPNYLKSYRKITATMKFGSVGVIDVGFGRGSSTGLCFRVDSTKVEFRRYTGGDGAESVIIGSPSNHNLTLAEFLTIVFDITPTKLTARIMTSDGEFTASYNEPSIRESYGIPFVSAETGSVINEVSVRCVSDRFRLPVWVVGDSFVSLYEKRWTTQLIQTFDVKDFLVLGLAGGQSATLYDALVNALNYGTPKFLVWAMGMNDYYWKWKDAAIKVEMLCRAFGIELIYTTIPFRTDIPGYSKVEINAYVKASGYRYIDVYSAVSSDNVGTWYPGMCDDGVHPTILGAKAIAARVLADFPEIMQ